MPLPRLRPTHPCPLPSPPLYSPNISIPQAIPYVLSIPWPICPEFVPLWSPSSPHSQSNTWRIMWNFHCTNYQVSSPPLASSYGSNLRKITSVISGIEQIVTIKILKVGYSHQCPETMFRNNGHLNYSLQHPVFLGNVFSPSLIDPHLSHPPFCSWRRKMFFQKSDLPLADYPHGLSPSIVVSVIVSPSL